MNRQSIAIVGNPNCGKTTLFNGLTGSKQHVGNWPGVTVDKKTGKLLGTRDVEVVDLPGIYSFNADSEDQSIARDHILAEGTDLVVNIADTSNLERNLYLTMTFLEMRKPMILVLCMKDLLEKQGSSVNTTALSKALGIPVIAINALSGKDIRDVRRLINESLESLKPVPAGVKYPDQIESTVTEWAAKLSGRHPRQTAIMLLEENEKTMEAVIEAGALGADEIQSAIENITRANGHPPDVLIAEARFAYIRSILRQGMTHVRGFTIVTEKIDRIILGKWLGIPIFLAVMFLLFQVVVQIGGSLIGSFDRLFGAVFVDGPRLLLESISSPQWLTMLLVGGIGSGIKTVASFIPVMFFMFLMLSILEESGYMARAAFVVDRFMRIIGLPGKAFVPMLLGFGCTVPAVMAVRTLENKTDKYMTIFMVPFMSCGARLPVYTLFGVAFFGNRSGLMVFSIYLIGILMAILTGLLLKRTLFRGTSSYFVMELPPYHLPRLGMTMLRTWTRLKVFLFQAGKVIIIAVFLLSVFNSLGKDDSKSALAVVGEAMTPIFKPMGIEKDNWPAIAGLISGLFAKEAIIGSMSSLYEQMEMDREINNLNRMKMYFDNDWRRAFAFLLFVLIYFPCVSAFSAITREIGYGYGWLAMAYLTILAWCTATLFFQISVGHSMFWISFSILLIAAFIPVFNLLSGRWSK